MTTYEQAAQAGNATRGWAGRLPARDAFYLQASIVVAFLAASSAPTPLYGVYESAWGFSPITVTLVFGVYAIAVLAALLTLGSLSDHVGRRPILFAALALQSVSMLVFADAHGVAALVVARIVQGVATGGALGALGAGMLDVDKAKGAVANGVAPMLGTGSGALVSGLLVQYLPAPTHLVYLSLIGVFAVQAVGVALMTETSSLRPGAARSLRPRIGVPPAVRRPLALAVPVLVAVWALGGFYASLGPTMVRLVSGSSSSVLGGLALFVLAVGGAGTVLVVRTRPGDEVFLLGTAALIAGVATTLAGIQLSSTALLFVGTAIAGVGFGAGFQGALRTVLPLAETHEVAGILAAVYVVSYLALGVPAVIGGVLAVHGGVLATAREYGAAVMALGAVALAGTLVRKPGIVKVGSWRTPSQERSSSARTSRSSCDACPTS
jgi:predicted MFS family arabinose efflux permease